jgi:hypothetical protein
MWELDIHIYRPRQPHIFGRLGPSKKTKHGARSNESSKASLDKVLTTYLQDSRGWCYFEPPVFPHKEMKDKYHSNDTLTDIDVLTCREATAVLGKMGFSNPRPIDIRPLPDHQS